MKIISAAIVLIYPLNLYSQVVTSSSNVNEAPKITEQITNENKENLGAADVSTLKNYPSEGSNSNSSLSIRRLSIGAGLPDGGSNLLNGSISLRYFLNENLALSTILLGSYDKQTQQQSLAGGLKAQNFFSEEKSSLFAFFQCLVGQNTTGLKINNIEFNNDLEFGIGTGLGIEVWLIPQVSFSIETGLSARLSPSSKLRVTTGTSRVGLYVHN